MLTTLGLAGGLYYLSRAVLIRGFSALEDEFARQNLDRARSALLKELDTLDHTTSEYGAWDQAYAFVKGRNPSFIKTEFPAPMFRQLHVGFVLLLDNSGKILFSKGFDLANGGVAKLPEGITEHLKPGSLLSSPQQDPEHISGLLKLPAGLVLVDSRPILTSNAQGPSLGTITMGLSFDEGEIVRLGDMIHTPLTIAPVASGTLTPEFSLAAARLSPQDPTFVQPLNAESLAAYTVLTDIYGRPAALMRVVLPRSIYQQSHTSLLQILLLLLAAVLFFGAVTLYLLERTILSRVAKLTDDITQVGASGDLSARLSVQGNDELAYLGNSINAMLEDLERAQTERHVGRARLGLMIEKVPAVLWSTDRELRFTSSVGAGLEAIHLRPNEVVGKSLFEYFQTNDPDHEAIAAHRKAISGEAVTYEIEFHTRVFESHVQPLRSSEGDIVGVIGVALDITDRKRLADQLRQSQKMQAVGELAGGIAHDFNNLLMVMKGHAEMLLDQLPSAGPVRHSVEQMQHAAERAEGLTRQLLAFSRRQVLQPRVLDLNEVVGGMIKMVSRVIGENIELAFLPGSNLARVKADPSQMEQVVLNLVVNARDAMPGGGRLTIETSNVEIDRNYGARHAGMAAGPYVMIVVSDTGSGMDAATQARIFEPFFTTKGPGKGTGLGLATVYGVVKQSGGFIWVYSEVGRGTTFKIYLPQVVAEVEKRVEARKSAGPPTGNETILFVEDEDSVRELVREYLTAAGYHILEAADGEQALKIASEYTGPVHLLITDVVMPHLSGRELAARISPSRSDLKVLFISGYTDDSIFRSGVLEGGMAFLQKPFNLKTLAQKVREVLDGRPAALVSPGSSKEDA
ncbi:MAG TPA: CHASE4 domain-containing protein [Candidatus Limnocylindrales bacterium]|nr:CHASE4 domain-containing protein [Candidatus Limnocylindrales bacterium]